MDGIYLPGNSNTYISTPDAEHLDLVNDFSLIATISPEIWAPDPPASQAIISKATSFSTNCSFMFYTTASGGVRFLVRSTSDSVPNSGIQSPNPPLVGIPKTLGVTYSDAGLARLWEYIGGSWEILHETTFTVTTAFVGSTSVNIGALTGADPFKGIIHRAAIFSGIGDNSAPGLGTPVADFDATVAFEGNTYVDTTVFENVWTIHGNDWEWAL